MHPGRLPCSGPASATAPATKLWLRSLAAKASAMPAGMSSAETLTIMESRMTSAASSAAHSLAVIIAADTRWSSAPCRAVRPPSARPFSALAQPL